VAIEESDKDHRGNRTGSSNVSGNGEA